MVITSLKEKELYKFRTPIFNQRNAETERGGQKRKEEEEAVITVG